MNPNPRGGTSWSAWRAGRPSEQLTVGIEGAAGEPKWTRNRFARDLALAPNDLIQRGITRLACP